jgi:hypothetical protein
MPHEQKHQNERYVEHRLGERARRAEQFEDQVADLDLSERLVDLGAHVQVVKGPLHVGWQEVAQGDVLPQGELLHPISVKVGLAFEGAQRARKDEGEHHHTKERHEDGKEHRKGPRQPEATLHFLAS